MKNHKNFDELKIDNTQESDKGSQSCQESWWSSWSGLSQQFDSKGKKSLAATMKRKISGGNRSVAKELKKLNCHNLKVLVCQNIDEPESSSSSQ